MIIGSHNSAANSFDYSKCFWSSGSYWSRVRWGAKYSKVVRQRVCHIARTQEATILEQLRMGVQALDLRVSWCESSMTFHCNHTFSCGFFFEDVMSQVLEYLDESRMTHIELKSSYMVHVLVKPDWETRHTMLGRENVFLHRMEEMLSPYVGNVLCYFPLALSTPVIRPLESLNNRWLDVSSLSSLKNGLECFELESNYVCVVIILTN